MLNARILFKSVQPLVIKAEGLCDSWIHPLGTQPESMQHTWTQPLVRMVKRMQAKLETASGKTGQEN
jgi:hypothetical protein